MADTQMADKKKLTEAIAKSGGVVVTKPQSESNELGQVIPASEAGDYHEKNLKNLDKARKRIGKTVCVCGRTIDNRGLKAHQKACEGPKVERLTERMSNMMLQAISLGSTADIEAFQEWQCHTAELLQDLS